MCKSVRFKVDQWCQILNTCTIYLWDKDVLVHISCLTLLQWSMDWLQGLITSLVLMMMRLVLNDKNTISIESLWPHNKSNCKYTFTCSCSHPGTPWLCATCSPIHTLVKLEDTRDILCSMTGNIQFKPITMAIVLLVILFPEVRYLIQKKVTLSLLWFPECLPNSQAADGYLC